MSRNIVKKRLTASIVISLITLFTFAGCQSKKNTTVQTSSGRTFNKGNYNPQLMKQKMEDSLKELVSAGTITQSQSDKILAALNTNGGRFGGGFSRRSGQANGNSNGNSNGNGNGQNQSPNSNNNSQGNNRQNVQRPNPLSTLVSQGVITQSQADAVMQKIRSAVIPSNNNSNNNS